MAKTIYLVLSERDQAMRCKDIQLAVESRLGRPVGWSNVKQCLSANSKGKTSKYVRVGHGRYLVRPKV